MADIPDLVIRTPEERRRESFPWGLTETRLRLATATVMLYHAESFTPENDTEARTWQFKTEESRLVFAAARIRELRRDGVDDIGAPYTEIYNECPDRRLTPDSYENPGRKRVRIPRSAPLEW